MATHTLTNEQMQKFVDAFKWERDFPEMTDDPKVNFAVDCVVEDDGEEPTYDEQLYADEVKAWKAHFGG